MDPSEQHDQEDMERRLRDAFAAKALRISDADLDREREDEVAAVLSSRRRTSPATRIFAGIGAAAAAAAIVVATVVGLHNGNREVVNGLPPAISTSSASTTANTTTSTQGPTELTRTPALNQPATPGGGRATTLAPSGTSTASSSAPSSKSTAPSSALHTALSGPSSPTAHSSTSTSSAAAHQPPAMSPGLAQAGPLGDQEYTGAVPLEDPSGGEPRMLSMPSDLTWQRTAESGNSLTVRITYLPTDIEAYWRRTLSAEGWVQNGSGWSYPGTSYTVSPITDKGGFTVTW